MTVLFVEDEKSDVFFMREAFKRVAPGVQLEAVRDGEEAVDYLAGRNGFAQRGAYPLPALVLLELNLPVMPGLEVLKWMRGQAQFRELPVVVLSSSACEQDKQRASELGASWFIQKPASPRQFCDVAEQVTKRWLSPSGRRERKD